MALFLLGLAAAAILQAAAPVPVVSLPPGVVAVRDPALAFRESTSTRERVSINGLWRFQPSAQDTEAVPEAGWGWFKVPGSWPGITDYMHKDSQIVYAHPDWKAGRMREVTSSWYQREITIPTAWAGRRIDLTVEYLNSWAAVFIDGRKAGELRYPGGSLDLSAAVSPGGHHILSVFVVALPLQGVMLSYSDSARAKEVKGEVNRRGLCGDVWLEGVPAGPRITEVTVATHVEKGELAVGAEVAGLTADGSYRLRARVTDQGKPVKELEGPVFRTADLRESRTGFTKKWLPKKHWDLHTPANQYGLEVDLADESGKVLDAALPVRFGVREFAIQGRDLYLNGTRLYCSVLPLDNAQIGPAAATYGAARDTFARLQAAGFNAVYTHNYGCEPGSHLSFTEILNAADDAGMLVFFAMPHFGHYEWKADDAETSNGYARDADFYVRAARNHPSVVMYAMSHNGCGYSEDMNPDLLGDGHPPREQWGANNAKKAVVAERIVNRLDPSRLVYHHAGGDLGTMDTINFYGNFIPVQEMSDWWGTWGQQGTKPLFPCEFGVPLTWDWTMYRGWYKGTREFGSAPVPWEFCIAEWDAQFMGDRAFRITDLEKRNLRWEAQQFREGKVWHRWDYPAVVGDRRFTVPHEVFARYLTENLRALRGWGLSAFCLWDCGQFWRVRDDIDRSRRELPTDWGKLQRPGFSPDFIEARYETWEVAFDRSDWTPSVAGQAILRNNGPRLGFIGGRPDAFTSQEHIFRPGEKVQKTLIVMNNSRETETCEVTWAFNLPNQLVGRKRVKVLTGDQVRIPIRLPLPAGLPPGAYSIAATFTFGNGEIQKDEFAITVIASAPPPKPAGRIAIFDPAGGTAKWLASIGIKADLVGPAADLAGYDLLIIGRLALSPDGPGPDLSRVRDGLKVVVFEQSAKVLEGRMGFRVAEYGLRQVFARIPGHPALAGLGPEHLHDWRGEATTMAPRLEYGKHEKYGRAVKWCGIDVTRVWRCGNRGNVASILIEKPARGDFLPILEGGYSVQYSPLMESREGKGMVLFCQMDVTGRTESDPAAVRLAGNILEYAAGWKPTPRRTVRYAGDSSGRRWLESAGVSVTDYAGGPLSADEVLVVTPECGKALAARAAVIRSWLDEGGHVLAVGLAEDEANAFLPLKVTMKKAEHIAAVFDPEPADSPLAGIGPADANIRDPRELPLVAGGARAVGDGVLGVSERGDVVFCQLAPWTFAYAQNYGLKRTFRRTSCLVNRLLANWGAAGSTPLLARFSSPLNPAKPEQRWLDGLYLDIPEEWDDPYRFFRW